MKILTSRVRQFFLSRTIFLISIAGVASILIAGGPNPKSKKSASYDFKPVRLPMLSITMKESQTHVDILASDEFQGRETGTTGQWLAAKYIADQYASFGLQDAGSGRKYYQNFQIARYDLKSAHLRFMFNDKHPIHFSLKADFIPFSFSGENSLTAPVVFAGYGITAPEYHYDDYQHIDVRGKIVLVLRHEPQEKDPKSVFEGTTLTKHSLFEEKAKNAQRHGALAMLLVTDPGGLHGTLSPQGFWPSFSRERIVNPFWRLKKHGQLDDFPAVWIDGDIAEKLVGHANQSLEDLQKRIDDTLRPRSFVITNLVANVEVDLDQEVRETQNVLAMLPGSDSQLQDEVVIVGAHYDHLGIRNGRVYYGADDNASGTAGLLEIAEAFSEMPERPRRSVLFAAFSAEELGLLGSEYYVENPSFPLHKTVAMINLDMIGRNEDNTVSVIGSNRSRQIHELNIAANEEIGLNFVFDGERYFNRSDQANFAKYSIPVIFYNTNTHEDYHRPSDVPEKIVAEKMTRIARLAFLVAWELANMPDKPTYERFDIDN